MNNNKGDLHQHIMDFFFGFSVPKHLGFWAQYGANSGRTNVTRMGRTGGTTKNDHLVLG